MGPGESPFLDYVIANYKTTKFYSPRVTIAI